ncbi:hypothetical protein K4H28_14515 [Deefgea tanakiae]|uniref:Uncharacterized protein n=1 Tax=Deefgea tanakiae TaxID=2865840 RepID=A0ABX8Z575_9NEIS|nr:hypothetical protein [Deefgea tanakiae]QZA77477.1 hypothetical protein K4H28_14515 [Deefgea tanakiae]
MLDALRRITHEAGNEFTGFDALLISVREIVPSVESEELRYVLNVLARPTELWAIDRSEGKSDLVSEKQTNLIERTYYADDYRLTATGRDAISICSNITDFAYAEGDALKLLRAIETGDFDVVPSFSEGLLDTIRYASIELQLEIERGHVDRDSDVFKVKLPRFRDVIQKTSELLRQAEARLKVWRAQGNDELDDMLPVDVFDLEYQVLRVYQALEAFGRNLAELTRIVAKRRQSAVSPTDFLDVALNLVKHPPSDRQLVQLFRQFGPLRFNGLYLSPMDVKGKVRVVVAKEEIAPRFDTTIGNTESVDQRLKFLNQYADAISSRLATGPLSLSEALKRGWCILDDQLELAELLGIYISPWALGEEYLIEIRIPRTVSTQVDRVVGELIYSDLELARLERTAIV